MTRDRDWQPGINIYYIYDIKLNHRYEDMVSMAGKTSEYPRKLVALPQSMVDEIDEFRFANRCRTEVDAIRLLIERGLRRADPMMESVPPNTARRPAPPGPYPWEKPNLANASKALNVSLPARLKAQLDWLSHHSETDGPAVTLRTIVIAALTAYVDTEFEARGLPG
jgi:hypothetical protein